MGRIHSALLAKLDAISQCGANIDAQISILGNMLGVTNNRFGEVQQKFDLLRSRVPALEAGTCSTSRVSGFPLGLP